MSGAGNIFTVIDNSKTSLSVEELSALTPNLTNFDKYKTEGLMAISKSSDGKNDFDVLFFNPDGSSGMMCGNGGRCAIRFAEKLNLITDPYNINFQMAGKHYSGKLLGENIELVFDMPLEYTPSLRMNIGTQEIEGDYVNVGTEHFVVDFNELDVSFEFDSEEMVDLARHIRYHGSFSPKGANANIFVKITESMLRLTTFERGVEAVTGACGTGAVSTAFSVVKNGLMQFPVNIIPPSGIQISVDLVIDKNNIERLLLIGPAEIIDEIEVEL